MTIEWKEEQIPISKLKNYTKNPRRLKKHDKEHLERSLKKFGQCENIIINTDYTIIGGHQRIKTLKSMGQKTVNCKIPARELTSKEMEELNIRLNRVHGDFDFDCLANDWNLGDLLDWGFLPQEFDLDMEEKPEKKKKMKITIEIEDEEDYFGLEQALLEMIGQYPSAKLK